MFLLYLQAAEDSIEFKFLDTTNKIFEEATNIQGTVRQTELWKLVNQRPLTMCKYRNGAGRKCNIALTCTHKNSLKVIKLLSYVIILIIAHQLYYNFIFRTLIPFYNLGTRNNVDNITSRLDFMNITLWENDKEHEFPIKSLRAMVWRILCFRMTVIDSVKGKVKLSL
jgi:hypothetical protein